MVYTLSTGEELHLGKQDPIHDDRTLFLANYLDSEELALSFPLPPSLRWGNQVKSWPVFGNDRAGDCVFASAGHSRLLWSTVAGNPINLTTDDVIAAYSAVTGYDPRTGRNDNGANELTFLKWWRKNPLGNQKITAFAAIEPGNFTTVKTSIALFGSVYTGVALPSSGQGQMNRRQPWTVVSGPSARPGTWGGHAMGIFSYDMDWVYFTTWGRIQKASWQWFATYVDECYSIISPDWINNNIAPNGFALNDLLNDIGKI